MSCNLCSYIFSQLWSCWQSLYSCSCSTLIYGNEWICIARRIFTLFSCHFVLSFALISFQCIMDGYLAYAMSLKLKSMSLLNLVWLEYLKCVLSCLVSFKLVTQLLQFTSVNLLCYFRPNFTFISFYLLIRTHSAHTSLFLAFSLCIRTYYIIIWHKMLGYK